MFTYLPTIRRNYVNVHKTILKAYVIISVNSSIKLRQFREMTSELNNLRKTYYGFFSVQWKPTPPL